MAEQGRATRLRERFVSDRAIDLADSGLTEFPALEALRGVREIDLSDNELTTVAPWIGELGDLRSLYLGRNNIAKLPAELGRLARLEVLDVESNQLRMLPPEIGRLRRLTDLRVADNHLINLPRELGLLSNLKELGVAGNQLTSIPPQVFELGRLEALDLSYVGLDELPPAIGDLKSLRSLFLTGNNLVELPAEMAQLTALKQLSVAFNRLNALPEFGRSELRGLDLRGNEFVEAPDGIGEFADLVVLDLSDNPLRSLPPEIGRLSDLRSLYLTGTQLTSLPRELADLREDTRLSLGDNPWEEPLASLVEGSVADLFAYLRSLDDAVALYEAKVLIIGEGDVGKSSLRDALRGEPFIEGRSTTHGIELRGLVLPHPHKDGVKISLNMWDFGGQPVYRITHQFFFSRRALYLVVWKPREGVEENAVAAWSRRIKLRVSDDAKILIVATHSLERNAQLDYAGLKTKFGEIIGGQFEVDSSDGTGIDKLRKAIAERAADLPQMGERMSAAWVKARDAILARPEPQIDYSEFVRECAARGMEDKAAAALARILDRLGLIVYYADEGELSEIVVLKPEWLTKAISYVLDDGPTVASGGVLDHQRLPEIWAARDGVDSYPRELHPYFIRLMEKFDVSYRLEGENASLVGQLVPYERPELPWDGTETTAGDRTLSLICELDEPADGLVAWFTVRHHHYGVGKHWRQGVFLEQPRYGAQGLLEQLDDQGRRFELTVRAPSPDTFFGVLRDGVEYLISKRWSDLGYELLVPCRGTLAGGSACPFHFKFRNLVEYREDGRSTIDCHECKSQLDVAELLTGFRQVGLGHDMATIEGKLDRVLDHTSEIKKDTSEIKEITSETASQMRRLLTAVSAEVDDCPRLFSLVQRSKSLGGKVFTPHQRWYRLTLWCEHPDHEHPWGDAAYMLKQPKAWAVQIAPYARVVVSTLRLVVPIAGASLGVTLSKTELDAAKGEIDLAKTLVDKLPQPAIPELGELGSAGLTRSQGAGLRELRSVVFANDPNKSFGGLTRRLTPGGDFVFVCPTHYPAYDPGLPSLPE